MKIKKTILFTVLIAVIISGVFLFLKNKRGEDKQFVYGIFYDFFISQDSITYPLIFDSIRNVGNSLSPEINFGPQAFGGYEIFMSVSKMTRKESKDSDAMLIERGWVPEGSKLTRNGYEGRILSYDLKVHPVVDSQNCNFGYIYTIPLAESTNDLSLLISVSQPEWGKDGNYSNCTIFDDKNYKYLKDMIDHVISNVQPAF